MENLSSGKNNKGKTDHHGGRSNNEFQERVEIVTPQDFSQLLLSQPKKLYSGSWQRRRIQKVPPQVRLRRQQSEHLYDPMMVSLGPYHHGKPELRQAEEFKCLCLDWFAMGNEKKKVFLYNKIFEKLEVIRDCYAEVTIVQEYDDKALALMMLLDACIIINIIHNCIYRNRNNNYLDWQNCLGAGSRPFMFRDMMVLENQIPFQILKLLIRLQYDEEEEAEGFLPRFFSHMTSKDLNRIKIPGENEEPPIHFLEAWWRVIAKKNNSQPVRPVHNRRLVSRILRWLVREEKINNNKTNMSLAHRSVMDLKAKGIRIRPNFSPSLMDIAFTSHAFCGELQLPGHPISDLSPVIISNLIAFEVSPNCKTNPVVLSYVIFMKSLIQGPEDVKELQEKGILLNRFANHEKGVKLFKEIDTLGFQDEDFFIDVKRKSKSIVTARPKHGSLISCTLVFERLGRLLPYLLRVFSFALLFCRPFLLSIL